MFDVAENPDVVTDLAEVTDLAGSGQKPATGPLPDSRQSAAEDLPAARRAGQVRSYFPEVPAEPSCWHASTTRSAMPCSPSLRYERGS